MGLKLNGTLQPLVFAEDVSLLGDNLKIMWKKAEASKEDSKEADLKVNTEKTECMLMSCHQNSRQIVI